jgi:hypothetical protein
VVGPLVTALAALLAVGAAPPKSVTQVDKTWFCRGPVNIATLKVTITRASIGDRRNEDAVHLQPGCTGHIGRIDVTQWAGDGVKVADGVHDLTVDGGRVRCLGKAPTLHQDGIQVLGGQRITFHGLAIDCGRQNSRLINSDMFINQAGKAVTPPTDVVCSGCSFGGWAAHTVSIQNSIRSGVMGSTLCVARFPQFTLAIGPKAQSPVSGGNTVRQCTKGQLTIEAPTHTTVYPTKVRLDGLFLGQALGSPVTLEAREFDSKTWKPVRTVRTNKGSRWAVNAKPEVATAYRARLGSVKSPAVTVRVQPQIVLMQTASGYDARVRAGRSLAGRALTVQLQHDGAWADAGRIVLGKRVVTSFAFPAATPGTSLRVTLPAVPGYLPSASNAIVVR